jgi:Tol biopolymer transport system component
MSLVQRALRTVVPAVSAVLIGACTPATAQPSQAPASIAAVASATPSPAALATPTASPTPLSVIDGEAWLVYSWYDGGKQTKDLFLARPDGSDAHTILTDLPGEHLAPRWSPDGSRIAFVNRDTATPSGSIWTVAADGSGAAILTDGEGACPDGIFHPDWSPDGSKLAVICYPDPAGKQGSVATYDLATKTVTRLYTVSWPEHLDAAPSWSPDGSSLAFGIMKWDPTDQFIVGSLVAVVPVAGGEAQRLTAFDTNMSGPDWSPDGTELVMYSHELGNMHTTDQPSNLYAIKPDGTGQRQITRSSVDGAMRFAEPKWTPDGTRIVLSVATGQAGPGPVTVNDLQVAFVDAAGGEPELISPTIHGGHADLRPTP